MVDPEKYSHLVWSPCRIFVS